VPLNLGPAHGPPGVVRQKLGGVRGRREAARRKLGVEFLRHTPEFLRRDPVRERLEPVRRRLGGAFPAPRPPQHVRRGLALLAEGLSH
jgi:hypothetical protein